jgi:hypothetical protein
VIPDHHAIPSATPPTHPSRCPITVTRPLHNVGVSRTCRGTVFTLVRHGGGLPRPCLIASTTTDISQGQQRPSRQAMAAADMRSEMWSHGSGERTVAHGSCHVRALLPLVPFADMEPFRSVTGYPRSRRIMNRATQIQAATARSSFSVSSVVQDRIASWSRASWNGRP